MIIRMCDKCTEKIIGDDTVSIAGYDFHRECAERVICNGMNNAAPISNGIEWHDEKLGIPTHNGIYMLTIEVTSMSGKKHRQLRFAEISDDCVWRRVGSYETIETNNNKVVAWTEMPDTYNL